MECSISLFGAKIRTTLKADERKIEPSGTRFRKKTLKISWIDKIRNEDICGGVGRMKMIRKTERKKVDRTHDEK